MIYFVDEDVNETEPYAYHMNYLGYKTTIIDNADDAFHILINAQDIEAIVLDVMLATKQSADSMFRAIDTNNFVTTGLKLLEELTDQLQNHDNVKIPKKVILFSAATRQEIVNQITQSKERYGVEYLNKLDYDDVDDFADKIMEVINKD